MKFFISVLMLLFCLTLIAEAQTEQDLAQGFDLLDKNSPKKSLPYFFKAANSTEESFEPLIPYALYGLAQAYYAMGEYNYSAYELLSFIEKYKESVLFENANYLLAESFFKGERFNDALAQTKKYLDFFPDGSWGSRMFFIRGEIFKQKEDWEAAYGAFNSSDLFYPLSYSAKLARQEMAKLSIQHKFLKFKPSPDELYSKGLSFYNKKDYESASKIFSRLAKDYPKHKYTKNALIKLGEIEDTSEDEEKIIASTEKYYPEIKEDSQALRLYKLGRKYGQKGEYAKAISLLKKSIDDYPKNKYKDRALYYLGMYSERYASPKAALNYYVKLVLDHPSSYYVDGAILRAGHLYYETGDYENSYLIYSQAQTHRVGSETPQCLFWWGKLAEQLGRPKDAAGIYYYLAQRFDHTYQAYRAKEKLNELGYKAPESSFKGKNIEEKILASEEINEEELTKTMNDWQAKNGRLLGSKEIAKALQSYKLLMDTGLTKFAAQEAKNILSHTKGELKDSAENTLATIMQKSGEYSTPLKYVEKKVANAILDGTSSSVSQNLWQIAYPKGYWDKVFDAANKYGVDPYLTLAVIREESRFNPKALSRSSAHGLMQIIPSTGKILAKQLSIDPFSRNKMYDISTNIEMGTYYLSNLIKRFDGNVFLALAGYNGGPSRVKKWVNEWYGGDTKNLDIDEFVQNIPIRETRYYVQKVMGSYYQYKRLYD
ncbi:hypothetical protein A2310_02810 [candidate division WOR-1 bacterium RIFOXYB2_FULL_37_13]|uniref:Transglycosylase SLT domain-containing protein n=1 Tax=candidate division WOR-1 bacterium RIFOXYB2_FULL_37_13 TaxID=1802579 RepID=A0A1F4SST4_UNCSA|nr:MAG: hypothetical protein A2310_02810 [candidate division WOR-1 bacterium RIFOXYB2_FULL_37_13]